MPALPTYSGCSNEDEEHHLMYNIIDYETEQEQSVRKLITILTNKKQYCSRTSIKIDKLIVLFFEELKDDIHNMICDSSDRGLFFDYTGLHIDHDTEDEVENTVRLFPDILSRPKGIEWLDDQNDYNYTEFYPIQFLSFTMLEGLERAPFIFFNEKAVVFISILARVAIEFHSFNEEDRGGLLCVNNYVGRRFLCDEYYQRTILDNIVDSDTTEHQLLGIIYQKVLIRMRDSGLLMKDDITTNNLLNTLCLEDIIWKRQQFEFLVKWDPVALLHSCPNGVHPLLNAASDSNIQNFQYVFEYGIRKYPKWNGICLLFKKNTSGMTPFKIACERYDTDTDPDTVKTVIEATILDYSETPINTVVALTTAALEENIHLDCLYFLLRREPEVLQQLMISTAMENNDKNDFSTFHNETSETDSKKKGKRKRLKLNNMS